jgi:hypothetical protein
MKKYLKNDQKKSITNIQSSIIQKLIKRNENNFFLTEETKESMAMNE